MARAVATLTRRVDAIVGEIYGSLFDGASFRPCLQAIGRVFGSHITAIHSEDLGRRHGGLEILGEIEGPEFLRMAGEYSSRWQGKNLWIERGIPSLLTLGYDTGDRLVSQAELLESEYYRYFLKPADIRYGMGINVQTDGVTSLAILSVNRTASAGPFTQIEVALVESLRQHLVNAYAIHRRMAGMRDEVASLRASFDRLPLGMLVLDAEGRVLEQNAEASQLLTRNGGIAMAGGRGLHFVDAACQARFRGAISRLVDPEGSQSAEAILVRDSCRSGASALVLHLCALPDGAAPGRIRNGRVVAFLSESNRRSERQFALHVLHVTLDLTPMEASVVLSLRENHDPAHVALELGLAVSTVRSHLKHAFHKSRTTRQSELLRLVDNLLMSVPA